MLHTYAYGFALFLIPVVAEAGVQIVKNMFRKCNDIDLALLEYRTTPIQGLDLSSSQLLLGRKLQFLTRY